MVNIAIKCEKILDRSSEIIHKHFLRKKVIRIMIKGDSFNMIS